MMHWSPMLKRVITNTGKLRCVRFYKTSATLFV